MDFLIRQGYKSSGTLEYTGMNSGPECAIPRRWRPQGSTKDNYVAIEKFQQPRRHKPSLHPLVLISTVKLK
jgi:hypothetical protein